jgi:hypothetical protein
MSFTVRRVNLDLKDVSIVTREDMAAAGQMLRQRIVDRTARGVDAEGQPFAAYSDGYAEQKRKAGVGTGGVDLTVSGEMLRAITVDVAADAKSVTLSFAR